MGDGQAVFGALGEQVQGLRRAGGMNHDSLANFFLRVDGQSRQGCRRNVWVVSC